jgi:hypothetical protein
VTPFGLKTWPDHGEDAMTEAAPFACNRNAMTEEERVRYEMLRGRFEKAVCAVAELANGYSFRLLGGALSLEDIAEWVEYEEKCCPFFGLGVETGLEEGPIAVRITGREGVKEFIRAEFVEVTFGS